MVARERKAYGLIFRYVDLRPDPGSQRGAGRLVCPDAIGGGADAFRCPAAAAANAHYNWVGFYKLEETPDPVLVLGSFQGAPAVHTRIGPHQGLCGAAASSGQTIVVDDVNSDPRYLACSLETRAEIVVPVFSRGKLVGELDIDSHFPAAFSEQDRQLLEYCASLVGRRLENSTQQ